MRLPFRDLVVLGLPALVLLAWAPVALAAPTVKAPAPAATAASADTEAFVDTLAKATAKFQARDLPAAIELYQKAVQIQPESSLGFYLLGEAQLSAGNLVDAEAAWLKADFVADKGPPEVKAKLLFVIADLRERQKKWDDAKAAWERYADFATKHAGNWVFPQTAVSRLQVLDAMTKQDQAYVIVRQRIKEEKTPVAPAGAAPPK